MAHELSRVVDALPGVDPGYVETRVAGDPWEEYTMKTVAAPVSLAGSQLSAARHVCAFFHNPDEEYRVLLPFIQEGFTCGDRAFHVVDPTLQGEHLRRLESAGIALMWPWQHRAASSRCTIGMTRICTKVISINMG